MAREIFGDVVRPRATIGSGSRSTVLLSVLAHLALTVTIVVVPLVATDTLPPPSSAIGVFVKPATPPPPPPPPPAAPPSARRSDVTPPSAVPAPTQAPSAIHEESPATVPSTSVGVVEGVPGGVPGGTGSILPVAPPPPPQVTAPRSPVRVGSIIKAPKKIKDVRPIYPSIAQSNRVEGRVIIEATIGVDGRVTDTKVLKSVTLLDRAAVEAVMQWQFTPTLLNGVPVPVILVVTVDFTLK